MTALNIDVQGAWRSAKWNTGARDHVCWIAVVLAYKREVKSERAACSYTVAESQIGKVVVCESRENAVRIPVFAVEVNGPSLHWPRFQAEDRCVRLIINCLSSRSESRSPVEMEQLNMAVSKAITRVHRIVRTKLVVCFNCIHEPPVVS